MQALDKSIAFMLSCYIARKYLAASIKQTLEYQFAYAMMEKGDARTAAFAVLSPASNMQAAAMGREWMKRPLVIEYIRVMTMSLSFPTLKAEAIERALVAQTPDGHQDHAVQLRAVDILNKMGGDYNQIQPNPEREGTNPFKALSTKKVQKLVEANPIEDEQD